MFGKKEKALRRTTAIGALMAGVAAISSPAAAQAQEQPAPAPAPAQAQEQEEEDIVVTGSRIRRNEFTSSSPVQIITAEQNSLEGLINTSEILQGSTVASGSQQINNEFTGFVVEGGPGVNTVSLRGLGANRTLVLLNGRRLNPAGSRGQVGAVDTNVIPESMIERVEILKDGASSIYGSDAVAGVVNIITKVDLDGGILEATGNISERGGGEEYQLNGAWGHVGDRAQGIISFEYYKREALNWGERDYLSCAQDLVRENGPDGRILDIIDPATGDSKCFNLLQNVVDRGSGGRFVVDPAAVAGGGPFGVDLNGFHRVGLTYAQVTSLMPGATAEQIEAAWRQTQLEVPTDSPLYGSRNAISPVERFTIFGNGSLDIGGGAELYGEFMYNRRESTQDSLRQLFPVISAGNPHNPFAGTTVRPIIQLPTGNDQEVDFVRVVGGIRGDFGGVMDDGFLSDWSYDVYVQAGYSDATYGNNFFYNDRVLATTGPAGCTVAPPGGNISNFNCSIGSVDYVSALTSGFTDAEAAFLFDTEDGTTIYTQTLVSGIITGDVFELPAGAVSLALGTEYRDESIDDRPGAQAQANNLWGQTSAGRTAGSDSVLEFFGEAEVPILAKVPLFESLTFNGSYRWTDYESYGQNDTYKLGLNWQITPEYRLRASHGTSYRAPALFELFLANQTGFLGQIQIDPCHLWDSSSNPFIIDNCGPGTPGDPGLNLPAGYNAGQYSSALIVTGGGAGTLESETSEATTYGFIWTPSWLDLSIAVDYFKIEVLNEVAQFGAGAIIGACMSDVSWPNNAFCNLFVRDENPGSPTFGMIQTVNNSYVNLDTQNTEGLDVTFRYEHEFSFGTFRADFQGTWTFVDSFAFAAGTPSATFEDFNGEIVDPDFTASLDLRFDRGDWTYYWDIDAVSKASNTEDFGGDVFGWRATPFAAYYKQYTEAYAIHSPSIRYQSDTWTFQVGAQNVFDEPPPTVSTASFFARIGNFPVTNQYDIIGRRYWAAVARRW